MQSHYSYDFDSNANTYNFTTKNIIHYRVAFIVDDTFSAVSGQEISNVFQLIVEKVSDEIEPLDAKVVKTIEYIIDRFFQYVENALIYICSEEGDRARLRHEIFERWYKKSEYRIFVVKIDNVFEINTGLSKNQKLFTSFLFHKQNSNYEQLIETYNKIEDVLNSDDEK